MPFPDPIVTGEGALIIDQLRSSNYSVDPFDGWNITRDGDAEFQQLTVRDQLAAAHVSVDDLAIGGTDIMTLLGGSSIGKLLSARLPWSSNIAISATSTKLMELNCGTVQAGRTYRVSTGLLVLGTAPLANTDRVRFLYRYTVDGTAPTTTSPTMGGGLNEYNVFSGNNGLTYLPTAEVDIAADAPLKVGLFAQVLSGSGTYAIYAGASSEARPVMSLYDDGPSGARNDAAISLTGGGLTRYTKTFNATWAWSVNGTNSYITQGDGGGGIVDQWGLVGFNVGSALAGAVTPVSLTLKWRPRTRVTSAGLDTRIASHNYASKAAAEADIGWPEGGPTSYVTPVVNVSNTVPGTIYSTSLGISVFNQFKAGTKKGVAFCIQGTAYSASPDGSGTIYAYGTNVMQLVAVYDGTS